MHDELSLVVLAVGPAVVAKSDVITNANAVIPACVVPELIAHIRGNHQLGIVGI